MTSANVYQNLFIAGITDEQKKVLADNGIESYDFVHNNTKGVIINSYQAADFLSALGLKEDYRKFTGMEGIWELKIKKYISTSNKKIALLAFCFP